MGATEQRTMTLNMGPQHPSTHGVLRLILELDGEIVVKVTPELGYLHRAIGKIAEGLRYEQFVPYTDRLDYLAASINNLGYVQGVEKLMEIEAPARARYLRVLFCELSRIESHLIWLGTHILDLGATTPLFYCFRERETIRDLFEEVCGARMTHAYFRIGGVRQDIPTGFLQKVREFYRTFPSRLAQYETLITNNPIFLRPGGWERSPRRRPWRTVSPVPPCEAPASSGT
jgi:NADH-quinone oxidoreductase subunit D